MLEVGIHEPDKLVQVAHALSTRSRVDMLRLLNTRSMNIIELAEALQLPVSTVANNVKVLEAAGLINTELLPAVRGAMKVCSRNYDDILISLNSSIRTSKDGMKYYEVEMPIGHYSDCEVHPTCGMASSEGMLVREDERRAFIIPSMWRRRFCGSAKVMWSISFRWRFRKTHESSRSNCPWKCARKRRITTMIGLRIFPCGSTAWRSACGRVPAISATGAGR